MTESNSPRRSRASGKPTHKVEYKVPMPDGTIGTFTRQMGQAAIAELLNRPEVVLLAINREAPVYYPRKKKGR